MKKLTILTVTISALMLSGCFEEHTPVSTSGVSKATAKVKVGSDGLSAEQRNIKDRLESDNTPGSIKHLYIISPYSGQVLIYSTVREKVTSSGKRLSPIRADTSGLGSFRVPDIKGNLNTSNKVYTNEIIQDDGTYGSSNPYIYWYDVRGVYHQHFFTGGQIIHVADQPMPVKNITINMELVSEE